MEPSARCGRLNQRWPVRSRLSRHKRSGRGCFGQCHGQLNRNRSPGLSTNPVGTFLQLGNHFKNHYQAWYIEQKDRILWRIASAVAALIHQHTHFTSELVVASMGEGFSTTILKDKDGWDPKYELGTIHGHREALWSSIYSSTSWFCQCYDYFASWEHEIDLSSQSSILFWDIDC